MQKSWSEEPAQLGLRQVEASLFACRSILKYETGLTSEQRNDVLVDIDRSLQFLHENKLNVVTDQTTSTKEEELFPWPEENADTTLRALYRIYYTYLDAQQGNNLENFITRFHEVKDLIHDLRDLIEWKMQEKQITGHNPVERVSQFITELYTVFVEFLRALSNTLEANDTHVQTDELVVMQKQWTDEEQVVPCQLLALYRVYHLHQQLHQQTGSLGERVSQMTAFLCFLEESSGHIIDRREEVSRQLTEAQKLIVDFSVLLSEYEGAAASCLRASLT